MIRRARIIFGVLILATSITLLVWGYGPLERIRRVQPIHPSKLQLSTPISLLFHPTPVS
jgi:hypothetical protein